MNDFQESSSIAYRDEKSDDNDLSDIWDDTALIKAYDKAIKSIRGGESNEESGGVENSRNGANKRRKRKSINQKRNKKKRVWKVGDRCRAVYTEDEFIYDAVIKLIDHDKATCWITFECYGNEEEKELSDLMSPGLAGASPTRMVNGDSEAGYESMDYPHHNPNPAYPRSEFRGHSPYHHDNSWYPPHQGFMPPMPPPMHWPPTHSMPPHTFNPPSFPPFPNFPGSSFMHQGVGMPPVPPTIPPPPPISLHPEVQQGDDDTLHAMLMSWYMSGYHTGYYQGLKQGRSRSQTASPRTQGRSAQQQSRPRNSGAQSR